MITRVRRRLAVSDLLQVVVFLPLLVALGVDNIIEDGWSILRGWLLLAALALWASWLVNAAIVWAREDS